MPQFQIAMDLVRFEGSRPPLRIWEQFFGPYPWFYAPFVGHFVGACGLLLSETYRHYGRNVRKVLPENLEDNSRWGQWHALSRVQFDAAVSQRLVRLDKAIQSIFIVRKALQEDDESYGFSSSDISALSLILPSTWVIEGFDQLKDPTVIKDIAISTKQSVGVVEDAIRGFAVTQHLATQFTKECELRRISGVTPRMLKNRSDSRRPVRPAPMQNFDLAQLADLYGLRLNSRIRPEVQRPVGRISEG